MNVNRYIFWLRDEMCIFWLRDEVKCGAGFKIVDGRIEEMDKDMIDKWWWPLTNNVSLINYEDGFNN